MKWKKIGDILIVDNKFSDDSLDNLESIASEHKVKSIIKIEKIDGQKREPTISLLGNNNERLRIAKLVTKGEIVVDMFAGIGYFSIPIGVHSQAKQIYSIEINPNSHHFLKRNIELNRINEKANDERMVPILGDCAIEAPKYSADRVLMGYVKTTHHFLRPAMECVKDGGIIHYHETVPDKLIETRPYERVKEIAWECGEREVEVLNIQKIKRYAPGVEHIVLDARIY